jgi:hypothetical protein
MRTLLIMSAVLLASVDARSPEPHPTASPVDVLVATAVSPSPTPSHVPGHSSVSGTIVRIDYPSTTVRTYEERSGASVPVLLLVDVASASAVWRETWVPATALAVGDDLFVSGSGGSPFVATTIDANIGRTDGTVRGIEGDTLILASLRDGVTIFRASVSRFVRSDSLPLADVHIGDTISAVVYYERDASGAIAFRRITKMWR